MVFNSLTFLLFFAVLLGLSRSPLPWRGKKGVYLVASYLFYAAWNPPFVALLAISTVVDWFAAKWMARAETPGKRRAFLGLSLASNLGMLSYFKYGDFLLENFVAGASAMGVEVAFAPMGIILPVGISFYTFQTLSYTIDVYRGQLEPADSFLDFSLFVSFFPQLVAGPIVRARDFLPQCRKELTATSSDLGWGFVLLVVGLFEKVVLADSVFAPVVNPVFNAASSAGFATAWLGTLAFSAQIFFDFAGYSTCAIGVAMCLGFTLPDNFRCPYGAIGFSDFWRRWHISLSTWLRDYLYIPLGGNRRGSRRTAINLALTMLLGGLWHGPSWQFVAWGALHGLYLQAERWLQRRLPRLYVEPAPVAKLAMILCTYLLVCLTWVFFRAATFADAFQLLTAMTSFSSGALELPLLDQALAYTGVVLTLTSHAVMRETSLEDLFVRAPRYVAVSVVTLIIVLLVMTPGEDRAFIYFQF